MSVQVTPELAQFVKRGIENGLYGSEREAMDKAPVLLQKDADDIKRKKNKVRSMIEEGMKGPFHHASADDVIGRAEAELDQEETSAHG